MHQYENMIRTQLTATCERQVEFVEPTLGLCAATCFKRKDNKKLDGLKHVTDAHQFPEDEEPNILGHGTPMEEKSDPLTTEKLMKFKTVLNFEDAPDHLKFNPYIRRGYRTFLSTKLCLQSVFWWTNETINIWSHLFGCLLFIGLTIFDFQFLQAHADVSDQVLVVCLLVCFCLCMLLSSIYHIFSCKSEEHYDFFLSVDFLGICLSLVAIYISGMYYAFWCFKTLRLVYSVIALCMFGLAMMVQIPKLNVSLDAKIAVLVLWAAYGIIPLAHWTYVMGGFDNELVRLMVPRIIGMYGWCAVAFVIYAAKIPERWLTGKVDYVGHSHNWWHLFILAAFYHWHNTGLVYAEYRLNNGCSLPTLT
nr:progestin and adipoQ receptor family member 3 isoform X1 [Bactrocera oleae]XP_036212755.1 progestin and adipoQ receptor family member 3 isoform X1 [Bactrocera oleae]XP_036212756.1 progestin and adipoQ receptor family member 3 isoform X1 [Bactrocera oleae]XP_036212757.1 progestin and adipoQ receptor family member 3 isoform X1 [Bactrocera oleae]XP_036212758.1 progestin and adipoQ receptor family member 3 isoform X1 [Bactrocera oleae]XP_036212759.1 progestin and adipoQ receptor family member 3